MDSGGSDIIWNAERVKEIFSAHGEPFVLTPVGEVVLLLLGRLRPPEGREGTFFETAFTAEVTPITFRTADAIFFLG